MSEPSKVAIVLSLSTGGKRVFFKNRRKSVQLVANRLDDQVFERPWFNSESTDELAIVPGSSIVGINVVLDKLPGAFLALERTSKTLVTQIDGRTYGRLRQELPARTRTRRDAILSVVEFANGEECFLHFNSVAESGMSEQMVIDHLQARPVIPCRHLTNGFSIWNTAQVVSWHTSTNLLQPAQVWAPTSPLFPEQRRSQSLHAAIESVPVQALSLPRQSAWPQRCGALQGREPTGQ